MVLSTGTGLIILSLLVTLLLTLIEIMFNRQHLVNFMNDLDLVSTDQLAAFDISHTYMTDDGLANSWPDNFLLQVRCTLSL